MRDSSTTFSLTKSCRLEGRERRREEDEDERGGGRRNKWWC